MPLPPSPPGAPAYRACPPLPPPPQVLQHTEAAATASDDAVVIFGDVAVLAPRGRFEVEMHLGFLSLVGQVCVGGKRRGGGGG